MERTVNNKVYTLSNIVDRWVILKQHVGDNIEDSLMELSGIIYNKNIWRLGRVYSIKTDNACRTAMKASDFIINI